MLRKLILSGFVCAGLAACGGGGDSGTVLPVQTPSTSDVTLNFSAVADTQPLHCNQDYSGLGTAASTTQLKDFRFFVHNVRLVTSGGTELPLTLESNDWQAQGVALLDFEDATGQCTGSTQTRSQITGTVEGTLDDVIGVRFMLGVPQSLNHTEQASVSPFNVPGMNWGWTNGYKFLRVDVPGWNVHIGATGCAANAQSQIECTQSNRTEIDLTGFDPDRNSIQFDYAALVQDNDISTDTGGAAGCMSGTDDPECNGVFTQLGLNLSSGEVDGSLMQTVFSVN